MQHAAPVVSKSFGCNCCHLDFQPREDQIIHYQSNFHRFNLKRKIAGLPPVSEELYKTKLEALKATKVDKSEKKDYPCTICHKVFHTNTQFEIHLSSKKHDLLSKLPRNPIKKDEKINSEDESSSTKTRFLSLEEQDKMSIEEVYEYRKSLLKNSYKNTDCLFCEHSSDSIEDNITHMSIQHSFFIPDLEFLTDLDGYLNYLWEKIHIGWACICCSMHFSCLLSVKSHMVDAFHCHLPYGIEDDLGRFYDYSSMQINCDGQQPLEVNEYGELVLDSAIAGHRDLKIFYKKLKNFNGISNTTNINTLDRFQNLCKYYTSTFPPPRLQRIKRITELKTSMQQNNIMKLRYRSDCPK